MLNKKALAGTAGAPKLYVEDVMSSYLYAGTGSTQTITNNIDLSTEGGLVWGKMRNDSGNHFLQDTVRGTGQSLTTNNTDGNASVSQYITAFNNNGFTLGTNLTVNGSTYTYVSWTFRKAKKFFDVVTYTGNGSNRTISHNLGSVPGSIFIKRTDTTGAWAVYHRSLANTEYLVLNTTDAKATGATYWNSTTPTSTEFSLGTATDVNANSGTYVAYLFAHDAGGFGDAGSDSIIKCGSYTGNSSSDGPTITLDWEPQWLLIKNASASASWRLFDNMRGLTVSGVNDSFLAPNNADAEDGGNLIEPLATGFKLNVSSSQLNTTGNTYIYIAIRRGPMKTPETGTSVFTPTAFSGNDTSGTRSAGLNAFDLLITKRRTAVANWVWMDKLRGLAGDRWMASDSAQDERVNGGTLDQINTINGQYTQDGINITKTSNYSYIDSDGHTFIWYALKRAPKFFDEVCYTGTGSARTVTHNLGVTPELILVKSRSIATDWAVYCSELGNNKYLVLNSTQASSTTSSRWNNTSPTSSVFTVGTEDVNNSSESYVAYLFASLSGVSKVGSYTGNGSSQTINCGFTNGARLVLIKRTDSTGDWFIYDTARGIVSGNESQMKLNTDAAQATGFDPIDPDNSGFIVNNDATNFPINVNSATYIYLAIA